MFKSIWSKLFLTIIIVIFVVAVVFSPAINYYISWLWFNEIGLKSVFLTRLNYKLIISVFVSGGFLIFLLLNLRIAKFLLVPKEKSSIFKLSYLLAFIFALIMFFSYVAKPNSAYLDYLKVKNSTSFNIVDPILHKDVSYYVFKLPFYEWLFRIIGEIMLFTLLIIVIVSIIEAMSKKYNFQSKKEFGGKASQWLEGQFKGKINIPQSKMKNKFGFIIIIMVIGLLFGGFSAFLPLLLIGYIYWRFRQNQISEVKEIKTEINDASSSNLSRAISFHRLTVYFGILVIIYVVINAVKTFLVTIPSYLYQPQASPVTTGIGYAEAHVYIPYIKIVAILTVVIAIIAFIGLLQKKYKFIITGVIAYVLILVIGNIYYQIINYWVVKPNELDKQRNYISNHIDYTRKAWGIDKIGEKKLTGDGLLAKADIEANSLTFKNVRLWSRDQLDQSFSQLQSLRTYYDFPSIDDDRYTFNDEYRQVMISSRELNYSALPSQSFINNHFIYTHGMGVVASPTNEVTTEGLPVLLTKDIPPKSSNQTFAISEPRIYFGEGENNYIFTNTANKEFDYPVGDKNNYTAYSGKAGIAINGLARKAAIAWNEKNLKILLSSDITNDSKYLFRRQIIERGKNAYPYLLFDSDPYIVIDSTGRLIWMLDAYTATHRYPYAEPTDNGWNYARNSVKITIDAYNGDINAYIIDGDDPIIKTYRKIFPEAFQPVSDMPLDLQNHLRYPGWLFSVQSQMYATFHMTDPNVFYNKEDQWDIPVSEGSYLMRHLIMALPGEKLEEFVFMLPYTPKDKNNLINWMVARNDGENYGQLLSYYLPKDKLTYGPSQIEARINQDPTISQQLTLWDQKGSRVVRGSLFVIPINEAFIYIQPIYIYSEGGQSIPEMKRVIVAYNDKIIMAQKLSGAINEIFNVNLSPSSSPTPSGQVIPSADFQALITQAQQYFDESQLALKAGDWTKYGEMQTRLKQTLQKLAELK